MTTMETIRDFFAQEKLAIIGVSTSGRKFSNTVYRELKRKGYEVFAVNPRAKEIQGEACWPSLRDLPTRPDGVVLLVPPAETEKVVHEVAEAGIKRVWMQQGAESKQAVDFCRTHDIEVVAGECIMMFAEPVGTLHRVHRFFKGVVGSLPE